jgi:hypothetical protein
MVFQMQTAARLPPCGKFSLIASSLDTRQCLGRWCVWRTSRGWRRSVQHPPLHRPLSLGLHAGGQEERQGSFWRRGSTQFRRRELSEKTNLPAITQQIPNRVGSRTLSAPPRSDARSGELRQQQSSAPALPSALPLRSSWIDLAERLALRPVRCANRIQSMPENTMQRVARNRPLFDAIRVHRRAPRRPLFLLQPSKENNPRPD